MIIFKYPTLSLLILLIVGTALPVSADNATTNAVDPQAVLEQVKAKFKDKPDDFSFAPQAPPDHLDDPETRAKYLKAWNAYYDYLATGLKYRMRVFRWQHLSTRIIFFTVLVLVASGILFSGIQFYRTMKLDKDRAPSDQPLTEFEASAKGIKVSSPVLGVIILTLSLAFFYLYLVHVYPIQETF